MEELPSNLSKEMIGTGYGKHSAEVTDYDPSHGVSRGLFEEMLKKWSMMRLFQNISVHVIDNMPSVK